MPNKILHIDLDAFFCAVEELRDPTLAGKAFAVGGRPDERGVVASCSYPARRFGVRSAMPMARPLRLCPGLIIVSSDHHEYSRISHQVMEYLHTLTPLVEQLSIDEAFLDVSDLPEAGESLARKIQAGIRAMLDLPCSLGVATNKLLAKTANDVGKASARSGSPPNAITIVPPGLEAAFLAPLPVNALWGIGPKTAERLAELGIRTIGDLAQQPPDEMARNFGKLGPEIVLRAQGQDDRPIIIDHETKSVSQEVTFALDVFDEAALHRTLRELSEGVGYRLRRASLAGSTVKLKLRWPDFTTLSRQITLEQPTDQDKMIFTAAMALFQKTWRKGQAVRLIGVGASGLGPPIRQMSLWDAVPGAESEKARRLQVAVDELRRRFGKQAVQRGLKKS